MVRAGYGRIVNIASIAGKEGNPNASPTPPPRPASSRSPNRSARSSRKAGVLVNSITPAAVETSIFDQMTEAHINYMLSKIPMSRFGKVDEVAALVCWLATEDCSFSTGAVFDISGGRATY